MKIINDILEIIKKEEKRQQETIELIASENITSKNIRFACGSILTNKYAEGYPSKRYYSGCVNVDEIEEIAINSCKKLFSCKFANVQAHSGSNANEIAYFSLLEPKDRILGMSLDSGGHLTHGYKVNFSGKNYTSFSYSLNEEGFFDFEEIERQAKEIKPKLIIAGASAYPRKIDFKRFREIADSVGSYLMVDMAHIAGLVATDNHLSPVKYADVITSTTHKTLRGPRGGFIITDNEEISKKIDKACFPGFQGGPLEHIIAGKAICFQEALMPSFKEYQDQVLKNSKVFEKEFIKRGFDLITGGTDNHLLLLDLRNKGITGKKAEEVLEKCNISVNKNAILNDPEKPFVTSGIRIGTPAITTRGVKEDGIEIISGFIDEVLSDIENIEKQNNIKQKVISFLEKYPIKDI